MMLGVGDVASNCGPNPCGFMDNLFPSAECNTYTVCAAADALASNPTAPGGSAACVAGGTDANGNTIVSCGGAPPCLLGSGPLQPGQQYCAGVLDAAQMASAEYFAAQAAPSSGSGPMIAVGIGLAIVLLLAGRR